ncbi:MAG: NUDIX hydrolase [Anaerolineae bacterium]|nr:NUDIX hydrolase [Anaerolineae bacterium]
MIETILETQTIYEGRIVNLDVHTVRLPSGNVGIRELIRHGGAAAVVPIDDAGHVVMVRQFRLGAGQSLLEIPAGGLSGPDEPPHVCATREMREEIGYKPGELVELGAFFAAAAYTTEKIHLYLGRRLTPSRLTPDDDEYLKIERIPFTEALEMAYDGRITDSKTIIGIVRAARHLKS